MDLQGDILAVLSAVFWSVAVILMTAPTIVPIIIQAGFDPIWFGVILTLNMEIGLITPPVGLNLFIAGYRFARPIVNIYLSTLPFFIFLMISVALIAFWPGLSLMFLK